MAEIPVQRRQRRSIWPLLVLLLLALAVAWYFWSRQQGAAGTPRADSTSTTTTSLLPEGTSKLDRAFLVSAARPIDARTLQA